MKPQLGMIVKVSGLTQWMTCGDGIRQIRERAEKAEAALTKAQELACAALQQSKS